MSIRGALAGLLSPARVVHEQPMTPVPRQRMAAIPPDTRQYGRNSPALLAAQARNQLSLAGLGVGGTGLGLNGILLKLVSLADVMALGRRGVTPVLNTPMDDRRWDDALVDRNGDDTPLDFQRVALTQLLLLGEVFIWRQGNGYYKVLPVPNKVDYDAATRRPARYHWQMMSTSLDYGAAQAPFSLPAAQVDHVKVKWGPSQTRGVSAYSAILELIDLRFKHLHASVQREILLAVFHLQMKGDFLDVDNDTDGDSPVSNPADRPPAQDDPSAPNAGHDPMDEVDVYQSRYWETDRDTEMVALQSRAPPVPPEEVERLLAEHMAQAFGLTGLSLTGDARNSNYSSSRLALEMDLRVWARYQGLVLRITRPVYDAWRMRELVAGAPDEPEWAYPAPISLDPVKTAAAYKTYLEQGVISRRYVRTQLGVNSAQMEREIAEERVNGADGMEQQPANPQRAG